VNAAPGMTRLGRDQLSVAFAAVAIAGVAVVMSGAGGVAAAASLAAVGLLLALWAFGLELFIGLTALAGAGFMPFLDAGDNILPQFKVHFIAFVLISAGMVAAWTLRGLAGRPAFRPRWNTVLIGALALATYAALVLVATDPLAQPSLAAPFLQFPVMALITYLWLMHPDALRGVRRALPIVLAFVVVWDVMYIAGSAGCQPCADYVSADSTNDGLLGPGSRLYTPGILSLIVVSVIGVAAAFTRATPVTVSFAVLSAVTIAFTSSRAEYFAFLAGLIVLLGWRLRHSRAAGRVVLVAAALFAVTAIVATPVGARAVAGYEDARSGTGTAGYRLSLVERSRDNWSVFGAGINQRTIDLGINEDLGLPNTLIVLGIIGGCLQIGLLIAVLVRGLTAGTIVGATLAAIALAVLVARPSLPLLELGHSANTLGLAVGFAAWLHLSSATREGRGPYA
jgi:hypothetical protein